MTTTHSVPTPLDALLTEAELADVLRVAPATVAYWRARGVGPQFTRAGRAVRYRRGDVVAWLEARTVTPTGGDAA